MRRAARWIVPTVAILVVWLALGVRQVDGDTSFGVVDGALLGGPRRVDSGWTVVPPGLGRLTSYPRTGVELSLPQAAEADLPASDGSRYGFRGFVTLRARPDRWRELHTAAEGDGLAGALRSAVRAAAPALPPISRGTPLTAVLRSAVQRELETSLADIGVDLRRLELASLDYFTLADGSGDSLEALPTNLLVVGLDGADWNILDPLLEAGRLPTLKRLVDDGVRAKLLSISPMLSPVIWTSVATGVEPTRHGVLDFLVEDPATGARQPVTSAQRLVPTVWEQLSRRGVDVGVVGWWASWPADAVRGYMVSDRIAYQLFDFRADPDGRQGKTWPPDLYDDIRPLIREPSSIGWDRVRPFLSGARREEAQFDADERELLNELRTLIASGESYLGISKELQRRYRPQLEAVYFEGTDTIAHLFMPYRQPPLPGVDPQRIESFSEMVDRYYEEADRFLGELLADKDESWNVMVLSDHGFASDRTRPRSTDSRIGHGAAADWHRRFGILILSGADVRAGARIDEASIYDIAPTIMAMYGQPVPRSWPGRVLAEALTEEFVAENPVRYRNDDPVRERLAGTDVDDPAAAELMEKLQSLGYISSTGGGGGQGDALTALNNEGISYLGQGRHADAEETFRRGLETAPQSPLFRFNLAIAIRFLNDGRDEEVKRLLSESLTAPSTLELAGTTLADIHLGEGNLDAADQALQRVLEFEPDSVEALTLSGRVVEERGDVAGARALYERAAGLDPDMAQPRNHLGNLLKETGDAEGAELWYQRAIEADPYFMGAYNNLALVYQERGEIDAAVDLYRRALTKAPGNAIVLNNLASLYFATGDIGQAREQWERALEVDPTYVSPLNNLASIEITQGNFTAAESLLRRSLELDPDYGDARLNLAIILDARGDVDGARAQLQRATTDPRAQRNSWFQLGAFELKHSQLEPSLAALQQAVAVTPRNPMAWNLLGEVQRMTGRNDDAKRSWQRSLQLNPNQVNVRQGLKLLEAQGG